jgi:hypothetical protein
VLFDGIKTPQLCDDAISTAEVDWLLGYLMMMSQ